MKKETLKEINKRQQLIISEPNGIVRETMITNLLIDIESTSYSEEDLKEAFRNGFTNGFNMDIVTFDEWFEQFKKK